MLVVENGLLGFRNVLGFYNQKMFWSVGLRGTLWGLSHRQIQMEVHEFICD